MRSMMQFFLLAFTFTFVHSSAFAQQALSDVASPDEVAAEIGLDSNQVAAPVADGVLQNERLQIVIDKSLEGTTPTAQTMQIYLDGALINTIPVSTGREHDEVAKSGKQYVSYTPVGSFKITHRERDYYSETWKAPMPYAQFFIGGIAIHATTKDHYPQLGQRASGGCVRVTLENAKMIWELVDQVGVDQVRINVIGHDQWHP